jgi:adenosylhomocysteine nucleosidase
MRYDNVFNAEVFIILERYYRMYKIENILTVVALPVEVSERNWKNRTKLIYSGVGKINTVINLIDAITIHNPKLVLNLGSAGSIKTEISDVVEVKTVIERDIDAFPLCERGLIPFESGNNKYNSGFEGVICASGDSFVREPEGFLTRMDVDIVDMELIAIARVCKKFKIPWRSFKYISDYIGHNLDQQWSKEVLNSSEALIDRFDREFL